MQSPNDKIIVELLECAKKVVLALSLTMVIVADKDMSESKMDDYALDKNREPKCKHL